VHLPGAVNPGPGYDSDHAFQQEQTMLQTVKKKLSPVLKIEGDAIKIPDIRFPEITGLKAIDGTIDVPPLAACKDPKAIDTSLEEVPLGHTIVAISLKLEGTPPKEFEPLVLSTVAPPKDGKDPTVKEVAKLSGEPGKNTYTFFDLIQHEMPPQRLWKLRITNENSVPAKVGVQIAYKAD
jgi:hypothetical protein